MELKMSNNHDSITAEEVLAKTYKEEVCVEKVVSAPVSDAYRRFHEYVWLKNGGLGPESWTQVVQAGSPDSKEGETRKAAGLVREKILRTIPDEEILYTVLDLPPAVPDHMGLVRFYPEGDGKTKIVWLVKFNAKFGFVLMVKGLIKTVFTIFLHNLESQIQASLPPPDKAASSSSSLATSGLPPMATKEEQVDVEGQIFTDETSVERVLSGPVPLVFQKFREVVWLRNGGVGPQQWTTIVEEGDPETHVGEVRKAAGIVQERILRVVENQLIVYSVIKGPMPVHNHMGSVVFTPVESDENKTKIIWTVRYTPMKASGLMVKGVIQSFFPVFLYKLESELKQTMAATS